MADIGFDIPDNKKIRVIVDTDAACEADDPFAIVHALLSPKLIVKGVIAEHFGAAHSMEDSYNEILTIKQAMAVDFPSFMGQTGPVSEDAYISEGVDFIIKESLLNLQLFAVFRIQSHAYHIFCKAFLGQQNFFLAPSFFQQEERTYSFSHMLLSRIFHNSEEY